MVPLADYDWYKKYIEDDEYALQSRIVVVYPEIDQTIGLIWLAE